MKKQIIRALPRAIHTLLPHAGVWIEAQTAHTPYPPRLRRDGEDWDMQNVVEVCIVALDRVKHTICPEHWRLLLTEYVQVNERASAQDDYRTFSLQSVHTLQAAEAITVHLEAQPDVLAALPRFYQLRKRGNTCNHQLIIYISVAHVARHAAVLDGRR